MARDGFPSKKLAAIGMSSAFNKRLLVIVLGLAMPCKLLVKLPDELPQELV